MESFFNPTIRGRLVYPTLQRFVDDVADVATINGPLPGGTDIVNYAWNDLYLFAQDEWKVQPDLHPQPRPALRAARQLRSTACRS